MENDHNWLGWKSWKKRWFILTRTSLVFFKNDPSALPQRGGEVNLTLGGIDLNNSGRYAYTAHWRTCMSGKQPLNMLLHKRQVLLLMGTMDIYTDTIERSFIMFVTVSCMVFDKYYFEAWRDKRPVKSLVVGRPILLALEDIDGGPSFLEKALRFLEKNQVEGILRQSADVEEVARRVQEYEQGKTEFGPDEDAHVIGDCVKSSSPQHVLRELPSSPVPASCCTALLEAYKIDRKEARMNAMQSAIHETFPEPNRRLLQSCCLYGSVALAPSLGCECELEDDYDVNGDNSAQLLAAANAANNAQAIITTLLEEYENIFDDDSMNRCSLSADSQSASSRSEDMSDDENPEINANGYHDAENEVDPEADYDRDRRLSGKLSESSGSAASDLYEAIGNDDSDDGSSTHNGTLATKLNPILDSGPLTDPNLSVNEQLDQQKACENTMDAASEILGNDSQRSMGDILSSMDQELNQSIPGPELLADKPMPKLTNSSLNAKKSAFWGRKNARRTPSTESIDSSGEEELAIQRLEIVKNDLRQRIAKEARGNAILQASLERRKQALHERRLALEQDVARLQEQLQAERDLRAALEVGLSMSSGQFSGSRAMDSKEFLGTEPRTTKGQLLTSGSSRQPSRKQLMESTSPAASKSSEASTSVDNLYAVDSASLPSTSRVPEVMEYPRHPTAASSTLVELTTRLDFFKERRSQLMEQLHNLDLNYGSTPQDFVYKLSSPPWN
ncbi:UNVERIFIED_CONTAM: Rho GTPase-activating protein 7 [Sesamum latifolium]|uniref:Rho GTPase-activating protein 7 n=1 Tax=Sesamum latifolium TaxID=2727402 RepID=A0AAW2XYK7_9LAMI